MSAWGSVLLGVAIRFVLLHCAFSLSRALETLPLVFVARVARLCVFFVCALCALCALCVCVCESERGSVCVCVRACESVL